MATLNITNFFSLVSDGLEITGKQGTTTDDPKTPFSITVTGTTHRVTGSLATASIRSLWDEDTSFPATFDYLFYWADQITYLQLIAQGTNVIHRIAAKQPFILPGYSTILAAANTTPIVGITEPTLSQLDSVIAGNYSGSTANIIFGVID